MPRKVLILGATSAIAEQTARLLVQDGDRLFLVGRNAEKLRAVADDLAVRGGASVERLVADLDDTARHPEIVARAVDALGGLDTALIAHGVLGDQDSAAREFAAAESVIRTNFLGPVSLLTLLAERFAGQGGGTILAISSVAGDRGRQSNYVYGSAKGALGLYLQGLRNRMHPLGVRVITIKPGFVDTPMTSHLPRGVLFASPASVAAGIRRALDGGADVAYLPWFWRPIMLVVRCIPERIFKRLKL